MSNFFLKNPKISTSLIVAVIGIIPSLISSGSISKAETTVGSSINQSGGKTETISTQNNTTNNYYNPIDSKKIDERKTTGFFIGCSDGSISCGTAKIYDNTIIGADVGISAPQSMDLEIRRNKFSDTKKAIEIVPK
jgi:hypothetical protein